MKEFVYSFDEINPIYIYTVLRYSHEHFWYICNEYEFTGIKPDTDQRVYNHKRTMIIPREDFMTMNIFEASQFIIGRNK